MRPAILIGLGLLVLATPGLPGLTHADAAASGPCDFLDCSAPEITVAMDRPIYSAECRHLYATAMVDYGTRWLDTLSWNLTDSNGTVHASGHKDGAFPPAYSRILLPLFQGAFDFLPDGVYAFSVSAANELGSDAATATFEVGPFVDDTSPTSWIAVAAEDGSAPVRGWFLSPIVVGIHADDDCRAEIEASLDGAFVPAWFTIETEGVHLVRWRAIDLAGNAEPWRQRTMKLDLLPPEITIVQPRPGDVVVDDSVVASSSTGGPAVVAGRVTLESRATDSASGVARVAWIIDGAIAGEGASLAVTLAPGRHLVEAIAEDFAGRTSRSGVVEIVSLGALPTR